MTKWITALALAGIATTGVAAAQDTPPGGGYGRGVGMLRRADTNGDGVVTRAEYQASVDQRFARMDANGNGMLDAGERPMRGRGMTGAPQTPETPQPAGIDPAPVSRAQYAALAMARFDRLDANHDGRIDASEMAAGAGAMRGAQPPAPHN